MRIQYSITSLLVAMLIASICVYVYKINKPRDNFEFVFSGALLSSLDLNSRVEFDSPGICFSRNLAAAPIRFPVEKMAENEWTVRFFDPDTDSLLFSIILAQSLFDEPRRINVKLDRPKLELRPLDVWYRPYFTAKITQRMQYGDLPFWNSSTQKLEPAPSHPILTVTEMKNGSEIYCTSLEPFCMGNKRFALMHWTADIENGTTLNFAADYDSGGLFATRIAEFQHQYRDD